MCVHAVGLFKLVEVFDALTNFSHRFVDRHLVRQTHLVRQVGAHENAARDIQKIRDKLRNQNNAFAGNDVESCNFKANGETIPADRYTAFPRLGYVVRRVDRGKYMNKLSLGSARLG